MLKDGDVIKFGTNFVRFNERHRKKGQEPLTTAFQGQVRSAPPPPPVRKAATPLADGGQPKPAVQPKPAAPPKPAPAKPAARSPSSIPPPPPPRKKP
jgi:hypothetical protein